MVWFDNTPAEQSEGALYSAWSNLEPSNNEDENCAFLDFHKRKWNDDKCDRGGNGSPNVLCQKIRYLKNDLSPKMDE